MLTPMQDNPSERLVDQPVRNRVMDSVEILAEGDEGVRSAGFVEYFESFFAYIGDGRSWDWRDNSTFTRDEVTAIERVFSLVNEAAATTPSRMQDEEFIATGWPRRI